MPKDEDRLAYLVRITPHQLQRAHQKLVMLKRQAIALSMTDLVEEIERDPNHTMVTAEGERRTT